MVMRFDKRKRIVAGGKRIVDVALLEYVGKRQGEDIVEVTFYELLGFLRWTRKGCLPYMSVQDVVNNGTSISIFNSYMFNDIYFLLAIFCPERQI